MAEDNQDDQINEQVSEVSPEQLKKDLDSATDAWKRALADFENYKRRQQQESVELVDFIRGDTFRRLLPALDSLEQALKHLPEYTTSPHLIGYSSLEKEESGPVSPPNIGGVPSEAGGGGIDFSQRYQNWQTGVNGLVVQLDKTLEEMGVKKIEAVGKKFDPHFHEAVKEVEGEEDGTVVEELQSGFELNGKVIRPSQVVISKLKSE
jgi:molecular chaperone GrpE